MFAFQSVNFQTYSIRIESFLEILRTELCCGPGAGCSKLTMLFWGGWGSLALAGNSSRSMLRSLHKTSWAGEAHCLG